MICKIGLSGATGKMGLEIANLIANGEKWFSTQFELADAVAGSQRIRSVEGTNVRTLAEPAGEPVHVWIDFSQPEATMKLLPTLRCPILIGTTGFDQDQLGRIVKFAESHAVLIASNTSPGMNLVKRMLRQLPSPERLPGAIDLTEIHHRRKKDSPSGSAKSWLEILRERGYHDVPVHAVRAGEVVGVHSLHWIADGEEIYIEHRATDRKVFARGALAGAAYLMKKDPGLYSMEDVFGGES